MEAETMTYIKAFAIGQILFGVIGVIAVEVYRLKHRELFRK